MNKHLKPCRSSWRGAVLREAVAVGVKIVGGDLLAFAKRYAKIGTQKRWHAGKNWEVEAVRLQGGAQGGYFIPRNCRRQQHAILHLHGGGYTLGYLALFKHFAKKLSKLGGGVPVFSLDYRVAPENPYPAALEDAAQAIEWLGKRGVAPESIIAVGESCGAGLALALAMRLRDTVKGTLLALVLLSPWTDLTCQGDSYTSRYYLDPLFGRKKPVPGEEARTEKGRVYGGDHDLQDPYLSPAFGEFSFLPPMLIHVGEYEMLYDDAAIVYKKAVEAGGEAEFKAWPGMFHVFQLADMLIPEARSAWREVGVFLRGYFV